MEFGRVPASAYETFDQSLPPDSKRNARILTGKKAVQKLYLGCPRWGRKEWVGQIYPKGTRDANFQDEYAKNYNAIEFNATHYQIFDAATIEKWAAKVSSKDFKFCPKVINTISHDGLLNAAGLTKQFLDSIAHFGDHLGPVFLQPPETFGARAADTLYTYLRTLPASPTFFVELRHASWYTSDTVFKILADLNIGWVITDTPGRRDVVHMQLSIPKCFIRFQAIGGHHSDIPRIDAWVQRIKEWFDQGLEEAYFFIHVYNEGLSPQLTQYAVEQFNRVCQTNLPAVKLLNRNLFD